MKLIALIVLLFILVLNLFNEEGEELIFIKYTLCVRKFTKY